LTILLQTLLKVLSGQLPAGVQCSHFSYSDLNLLGSEFKKETVDVDFLRRVALKNVAHVLR
jgi:hypothetical protein